jgi:hypothetical protein
MGGTLSYVAAVLRSFGAAVTVYGGGIFVGRFGFPGLIELAAEIKTPWLGLFGDLDPDIPVDVVEDGEQVRLLVAVNVSIGPASCPAIFGGGTSVGTNPYRRGARGTGFQVSRSTKSARAIDN